MSDSSFRPSSTTLVPAEGRARVSRQDTERRGAYTLFGFMIAFALLCLVSGALLWVSTSEGHLHKAAVLFTLTTLLSATVATLWNSLPASTER